MPSSGLIVRASASDGLSLFVMKAVSSEVPKTVCLCVSPADAVASRDIASSATDDMTDARLLVDAPIQRIIALCSVYSTRWREGELQSHHPAPDVGCPGLLSLDDPHHRTAQNNTKLAHRYSSHCIASHCIALQS